MSIQDEVAVMTLAGIGIVGLVFVYVISQATRLPWATSAQARAAAIRRWLFVALLVLGLGVTGATLAPFPIPDQHAGSKGLLVVDVVGQQWGWRVRPGTIEAGVPVEFRVTSADVNHGFGIYDPGGRLLAQTQAMPGVTNRLLYTFARPGRYRVLCLEYCGLVHHGMRTEVEVVGPGGGRP
jgi:cytochrome c oxidase subunit 2